MGRLNGKVAIVTGASRGIGKAISVLFAKEGAKVGVLARKKADADAVVAEIEKAGGEAVAVQCDVGETARIPAVVAEVAGAFGAVDILVNNAFDISSNFASVADASREKIESQLNTGFFAALTFMQTCYPYLERKKGCVINLGSSVGVLSVPGYLPYAVSKEAIRTMSRMAAREWGPKGIRVNVLNPIAGTDATKQVMNSEEPPPLPQQALQRMGTAEKDIAPVALFLASDDAAYITGYTLAADGGFVIDAAR